MLVYLLFDATLDSVFKVRVSLSKFFLSGPFEKVPRTFTVAFPRLLSNFSVFLSCTADVGF